MLCDNSTVEGKREVWREKEKEERKKNERRKKKERRKVYLIN